MKLESLNKGYTYHIYNRGINGENIFLNDDNKSYFLKLLDKYLTGVCSVFAYCLMNNHFHLLLTINSDDEVATQALSNFFNAYAKAFNKATGRTGSLFEKHFKRIRIEDENYLRQLVIYIHLNPKHHFNTEFEDFKFSSYASFLSGKETKLNKQEVIELFGDLDNFEVAHKQKLHLLTAQHTFE